MAGLEPATVAQDGLPATLEKPSSSKRSLPNGPCSYRDLTFGAACGCNQFWDKCSVDLHDGSREDRSSSQRSTWCVCGHHACFHLDEARAAFERDYVHNKFGGRSQLHPELQCNIHKGVGSAKEALPPPESLQPYNGSLKTSRAGPSQQFLRRGASQANRFGPGNQQLDPPSQTSASGLPRIPSVCLLSHDRRGQAVTDTEARQARAGTSQADQQVAGLGLSLINPTDRQQSISSTVPDEINRVTHESFSESEIPSTRANSIREDREQFASPPRGGAMDHILEFNRTLQLDVAGDTMPNTYNPEEFIQSATEVATPSITSITNTPDLTAADQAVDDGKKLLDTIIQLSAQTEHRPGQEPRPASAASVSRNPLRLNNSPAIPQEQLRQALRSGSPQALQKLVSYLGPLHNLLNSIPNVANTMRELASRLDHLENNSFNHVQPEEVQQQFEMYDGRLLELEHRMDDHERLHQAIDADQGSSSLGRRRIPNVNESFGSHNSLQSTTSSALILAAMDRKEMATEFEGIKDRLDILEAAAMPSMANPWEVEVVLLPWGPNLRGVWFSPDEPMHDAKAITQNSEDWTQSLRMTHRPSTTERAPGSAPHSNGELSLISSLAFSETESGWSSEAISDWAAGSVNGWLFPKACGSNNLVYKRLQSRGFVRNVTMKSTSARDIQSALSEAFSDLLEHLKYTTGDEDPAIESYPALRATFIPLRKVIKESGLRFLTPAEMSSSAHWSAQFLSSGVMMRISGGKRRLYVTQREAYLQQSHDEEAPAASQVQNRPALWTWQQIRLLPRYQLDMDSQMEGNEEHCQPQVAEADAREICWAFAEAYDLPPVSVTPSFSSHHSAPVPLSMRPADRQWRRSITPSSILKNRHPQPISPLSEHRPARLGYGLTRTVSDSVVEQAPHGSSKRRFNTSPVKHSLTPHTSSRNPSASISRPKRRRLAQSSPTRTEADPGPQQEGQVVIYNNTTRRSHEPPSPFFSSQPGLARTNSDITSRSQRSGAVVGKATPFAYATPYSGPMVGGGGFRDAAGDTEADDDHYQGDDGEQSWRGVDDDEDKGGNGDDSGSDNSDAEGGAEEDPSSFSGDESSFGSEDDHDHDEFDVENGDDFFAFGAQPQTDEDEDGIEVLDTLLGVLEH